MHRSLTFVVLAFVTLACDNTFSGRQHEVVFGLTGESDPIEYGDTFKWQVHGPIAFIETLKSRNGYTVHGLHKGWVWRSDIPKLVALLDSEEPCADVSMSISSYHHQGRSTVGREAAYLIEGFRRGEYPPSLNSVHFEFNADEIRSWWADYDSRGAT